jgi:hypothetical protein
VHLVGEGGHGFTRGDVTAEREAFTAALADQRLGLIGGRDVGDRNAMAVAGQARGACLSDAGRAPVTTATRPLLSRLIRSSIGCAPSLALAPPSRAGGAPGALTSAGHDCRLRRSGACAAGQARMSPATQRPRGRCHRSEEMLVGTSTDVKAWPILVDGKFRAARSGETIDVINPATGELVGTVPRGGAEDVDDAVGAARRAFESWRHTNPLERAKRVFALAELILEHAEELALLDVVENGSPIREMRSDAEKAVAQLRYFAGLALQLRGETIPGDPGRVNYTLMQPFGVVGRIVPFNHP